MTASGRIIGSVPASAGSGAETDDVELPRGELTALLYACTRDHVDYVFDDSIETLAHDDAGVKVTLRSGRAATYEIVIGADGLHSNTRRLAFGPEEQFHRYLGHCFVGFSVPNRFGFDHEAVLINSPGRMAALYAAGSKPELHALLAFRRAMPSRRELDDPEFQLRSVREAFVDPVGPVGWLLERMETASELFYDTLSQIVMPAWSRGRVALVGDAAAAPSFLSGEGTSLALVGGYVLAAELAATGGDHDRALWAYQARLTDYVRRNQALAHTARRLMIPASRAELAVRNLGLRLVPVLTRTGLLDRPRRDAATAVELPALEGTGPPANPARPR